MNSLSVVFIFSLSLILALASPLSSTEKELKAIEECNATLPIHINPSDKVEESIILGQKAHLIQEEKCFLNCYLQKVGFLDEHSNIKNGVGLVNYTLREYPQLAKYSEILIAQIFQIDRTTKVVDDKCEKAFVIYHQFAEGLFTSGLANILQTETHIKDKIIKAIENGKTLDEHISQEVKNFLVKYHVLVTILLNLKKISY